MIAGGSNHQREARQTANIVKAIPTIANQLLVCIK
jgi:hypothetical protein